MNELEEACNGEHWKPILSFFLIAVHSQMLSFNKHRLSSIKMFSGTTSEKQFWNKNFLRRNLDMQLARNGIHKIKRVYSMVSAA